MAKAKAKAKGMQSPKPQGSGGKNKAPSIMYSILTVLISLLLVIAVFTGAFYYVLHNDIQGLGERFRPFLQKIPVVRMALPPLPESFDPEDPQYLTQAELEQKYNELRTLRDQQVNQIESLKERLNKIDEEKQALEDIRVQAQQDQEKNQALLEEINIAQQELDKDRVELASLLAQGDTEGFKDYFEQIDKVTAQELYKEVVEQAVVDKKIKDLAKTYEEMDAKNAASILEELGNSDMELLLTLIDAMKSDSASEIMENMDPFFAAELSQKLADKILQN